MTNDDAIKIALKNELISDIEAYQTLPKYKISLKFDKKMKHLLKNYENRESAKTGYKRIPLKNRLLIASCDHSFCGYYYRRYFVYHHALG